MPDQLVSWLSVVLNVPGAITATFQLLHGLLFPRQHRRATRFMQLRTGPIAWTRLDIADDDQR